MAMTDNNIDNIDSTEFWTLALRFRRSNPQMGMFLDGTGTLISCHPSYACNRPCTIHAPSDHHMRYWPTLWRPDRTLFERICPHGIGHPDPDSLFFLKKFESSGVRRAAAVHGCDGCCTPPTEPKDT